MIVQVANDPTVTDALRQWRSRTHLPTELGSADLRTFGRELRMRSVFSARMTNADAVAELAQNVDDLLAGKINQAEARFRMLRKLKELGYDPQRGFPQDMANVPPAEVGSLQDLTSEARLDLMLETNVRIAAGYGQAVAGNTDYARYAYPAWQLVRLYHREVPRGSEESHSVGWAKRWQDAGDSVAWEGAVTSPLIARKDSPIWEALGNGAGGYRDTLTNPFPPFAFRSGMGWKAVNRADSEKAGLLPGTPAPQKPTLAPKENEITRAFDKLPPDLQAALRKEMASV